MIRLDCKTRRPVGPVRVLLNGREVEEAVALAALWNGGPGYVEIVTKIADQVVVNEARNAVCTQPRFGLVRVEGLR